MPLPLANKVALVTGASGGIGGATARLLAAQGARVALHYHAGENAARALANDLPTDSGEPLVVRADLRHANDARDLVDAVVTEAGRLDILINNAGRFDQHPPLETDVDAWEQTFAETLALNLTGPAHAIWAAARHMKAAGGGRIVNIGSRGAFRGEPNAPAYGAAKAGLHSLTQSMAVALAPHGIGVFAVAPGFVETAMARPHLTGEMAQAIKNQSPLGRVATVGDVAYWVGCLVTDHAMFATGTIIDVNGASYLRT